MIISHNNAGNQKFPRKIILTPNVVSQSSTLQQFGPEKAVDGVYKAPAAHTKCGDGENVWYKIEFGIERLVQVVAFFNALPNGYKARMDGTRVFVTNENGEKLCATFSVPADSPERIFSVDCNDMSGDGLILRGEIGKTNACIHMYEIDVTESVEIGINFCYFLSVSSFVSV